MGEVSNSKFVIFVLDRNFVEDKLFRGLSLGRVFQDHFNNSSPPPISSEATEVGWGGGGETGPIEQMLVDISCHLILKGLLTSLHS